MGIKDPNFTNNQLKEVIRVAGTNGIRPRLSCILLKGEIDSLEKMVRYMEWAESIGVDNVVFRQLMKCDPKKVKPGPTADFTREHMVSLTPLWEQIDFDPRFSFVKQVLGYYYYVEIYRFRGIDMVTETADLGQIALQKQKGIRQTHGTPIIYEMVFHPNGNLCGSWREWEDVILK
ncbi:MAG: hypothetical protein GY940_07895 [bacterium]|nr:hypothetical protein [bacterium]